MGFFLFGVSSSLTFLLFLFDSAKVIIGDVSVKAGEAFAAELNARYVLRSIEELNLKEPLPSSPL